MKRKAETFRWWQAALILTLLTVLAQGRLAATVTPAPGHRFPAEYLEYRRAHPEKFVLRGGLEARVERALDERIKVLSGLSTADPEKAVVSGTVRIPVIPVFYNNVPAPGAVPATRIQEILFSGPNPPDGTVTDFYLEMSYGLVTVTGDVFPYVGLPQNDTYYEGTANGLTTSGRMWELIQQGVAGVDAAVDFGQYDNDGPDGAPNSGDDDGVVDQIAFLHPEKGGECGNLNIWAHRHRYSAWVGGTKLATGDNAAGGGKIQIDNYTIQGVLDCSGAEMDIGTFAHETGHIFGIPDLYDTDGNSQGLGSWSLMAAGNWNSQSSPAHMTAWEKERLGWLNSTLLTSSVTGLQIRAVEQTPEAFRIDVGNGEYFLIENRQATGFDKKLKTCGLAIYHVHEATVINKLAINGVNQNQKCGVFVQQAQAQYGIALEQADGACQLEANSNRGDSGDLFPGSTAKVSFTGTTTPNTDNYNPSPTSVSVTQISSCGNVMTADVNAFALPPPAVGNVDALFLIDNSGSYFDDMPRIQAQAATVAAKIQAAFPTARFGVATFRDFPFSPFGSSGDTAFQVVLPFTSNVNSFLAAIAGIPSPSGGNDGPESQYEAVFQALTGLGRDLDGDNIPGNSTGEVAPSSLGWVAGRHRLLYLLTDADFHDSDIEDYPGAPKKKAAGRNTVRSLISTTYPPSQLTVFTLIADEPGTFITQGEDGSLAPVDRSTLIRQADELGTLTGGGVLFVGPDSSGLEEAVDTSISVLEQSDTEPLCAPSTEHLCLNNGRFRIQVVWEDFDGNTGTGKAVGLTGDTGYFWFFDPANVELVVKVLDGRGLNNKWWVFYGALSSVPYTLRVTDTLTGQTRVYANPSGHLASVGDTSALPDVPPTASAAAALSMTERFTPAATAGLGDPSFLAACAPGATNLCLNGARFKVEVEWKDFDGNTGLGQAVPLTGDTGYFWFFGPANVELVLKVLDGRGVNGRWWVFYGALSSVEYRITVTDTVTNKVKTYVNPSGTLASQADTSAFAD
ncbi:MAG TPA: M6 family metalloprotease domain-containing protein [Thermoanaerobaculia bacterium]|nr:M6 family metalloprotease domain-containing protein [Thermoanaerobaculia bacterium]